MLKEVLFFSLKHMRLIAETPDANTVVISILDRSEASQRPRFTGFRDVLELEFEDSFEELKHAHPGDWPDEPSDEEHARLCLCRGERVPSLSDARRVVEFLHQHHRSPDKISLVVHCYAGISRSAAVASWAAVRFCAPLASCESTDNANVRLLRLLDKADGRR